jgi:signal peptidase I
MMLFQSKENLQPASQRRRKNANIFDVVSCIILILIFLNNSSLDAVTRTLIIVGYIFVLLPICMSLGGTPGQILNGLRVRKKDDFLKKISIATAFNRYFQIILYRIMNLLGLGKNKIETIDAQTNSAAIELNEEADNEEINKLKGRQAKINFAIAAIIYIAWVIWLGNYWFLLGLPIIFDIYITKKVNWAPWKKKEGKNHWLIEWLDALIFAVVAVTLINTFLFQNYKIPTPSMEKSLLVGDHLYVSKVAYGPRIPNTPLSIPFMQHTIPGSTAKSYVEWIQWPYKRLAGLSHVKRDDPVVFNFPAGDTVCLDMWEVSFYHIIREEAAQLRMTDQYSKLPLKTKEEYYRLGREKVLKEHEIIVRPVDKRDNYIKRCVAIAGDTLQIIDGNVYINGTRQKEIPGIQYLYLIQTGGRMLNSKKLQQMGIYESDIHYGNGYMQAPLTQEMADELKNNKLVDHIERLVQQKDYTDYQIFPNDELYPWNLDQFGPLYIPAKGATVALNINNLPLYSRIIDYYEDNDLQVKDSTIYINGQIATSYTFKMNYYWMMGDNRHNSLDSRYWGFVPEDHIVGKPVFVWLSLNKEKSFPGNIRLKRMFMSIK